MVLIIPFVHEAEIPEWDIAHHCVKEAIWDIGFFKGLCGD